MKQRLSETSIPGEIKTTAATEMGYDMDPTDIEPIYMCLFTAMSKFLCLRKDTSVPKVALRFNDYKGNMYMAAVVQYAKEEDPTMPGNWEYFITFDPEDLKDAVVHESNDIGFHKIMADVTLNMLHYHYVTTIWEDSLITMCAQYLVDCLNKNVMTEEEFVIELPEYFTAKSEVKDGQTYKSIELMPMLNRLIKGDDDIAK